MARKPCDPELKRVRAKAWYAANRARGLATRRAYADANRQKLGAYWRRYNSEHATQRGEQTKAWRAANPERMQQYRQAWLRDNAERAAVANRARAAERRARARGTSTEERAEIAGYYALAANLTAMRGTTYAVDHIIPLRGRDDSGTHVVCGLHVARNLQVITRRENQKKWATVLPLSQLLLDLTDQDYGISEFP